MAEELFFIILTVSFDNPAGTTIMNSSETSF
jgi:hypothetical protein